MWCVPLLPLHLAFTRVSCLENARLSSDAGPLSNTYSAKAVTPPPYMTPGGGFYRRGSSAARLFLALPPAGCCLSAAPTDVPAPPHPPNAPRRCNPRRSPPAAILGAPPARLPALNDPS